MAPSLPFLNINTHQRPELACEIFADRVVAARRLAAKGADQSLDFHTAALPPGTIAPGLKMPNCMHATALTEAVRSALDQTEARTRNVTVIVPDATARIFLLDFDSLPSREREALPILRFRLRKLVPFDVDDAAISYQILQQLPVQVRTLIVAMPGPVRAEYESIVRTAGYEPGAMMTSTLASLAALQSSEAALLVNRSGGSITTAIARQDELLLHRTLELPPQPGLMQEELAQSVTVAVAYFEDTMQSIPTSVYYAGPGGAASFAELVQNDDPLAPRIRDLAPAPTHPQLAGLTAGVTGALAS
uniref:Type IV pilus assembly protein PilM n=1 Tax=Acidobacterium capsulatum TaxID=33075 RepID=A0A7V4XSL4_9BACT